MARPLTLDRAVELYFAHSPELSRSRQRSFPLAVRNWVKFGGVIDARTIRTEHFAKVRKAARAKGRSPFTIETWLSQVQSLLRHCGPRDHRCPHGLGLLKDLPYPGRPLKLVAVPGPAARMESLRDCYQVAGSMDYAPWESGYQPRDFWRAYLVLAYNTGLRLSDLVQLTWHDCDLNRRVIKTQASKTGKLHHLPINDLLFSHLDALPRHHRRVLAITDGAASYVGKKLHELCALAGCEPITAQMIRRRAACEFERVHPGAGALLLGHTLSGPTRVTWSHYIDPLDVVLRPASQKIPQPWG